MKESINYNGKKFMPVSNSETGEVSEKTVFTYFQDGSVLSGEYKGGDIVKGHLLGKVEEDGSLYFNYHHINKEGVLKSGVCHSTPTVTEDGLVLNERWEWTCDNHSKGTSILMEIVD